MAILSAVRSLRQNVFAQDTMAPGSLIGDVVLQAKHPSFSHLVLLVFEAVLEVICVSLPGYIVARQGMFDAKAQRFVADLNVTLFTPCLSMSPREFSYLMLISRAEDPLTLLVFSFHQARLATDSGEALRPCYHSGDFRDTNNGLLLVLMDPHAMLSFQEAPVQFCDGNGGMHWSSLPQVLR